jgi:hypothetical protein
LFGWYLVAKTLWNLLIEDSLWRRIIIQKYIAPNSLLNWITMERKSIHNVSNQWESMTISFPMIGEYLAWRVGNEAHVRIGISSKKEQDQPWKVFNV